MPEPVPLSEELMQALLAQSNELLAVTDGAGCLTWTNRCFDNKVERPTGPSMRLSDCAAAGPGGEATRRVLAQAGKSGVIAAERIVLRGKDGADLHVDARASWAAGRWLWTLIDRSAEYFLADQARRQGEWLDAAQEFGRLGLWEREIPSGDGRWDKHVFRFWGLDPAAGTPNFSEAAKRVHPDDRESMEHYRKSTGRAGRYAARYRVQHPDGTTRWIHSQWEVKNGLGGIPDRAVGVMMDDTLAYESARAFDSVNAQLKLAVDLGKIAIWRHDLRTQLMHYNDRAFEVVDMPVRREGIPIGEIRDLIHLDDLPAVVNSIEVALRSDRPVDFAARYRRRDGTWRDTLTRRSVERDAAGQPIAFIGVSLDVTEARQAERARDSTALAERELEAKSQFLSRMSHELRTPLNAVLGFTQLLQIEAEEEGKTARIAQLGHVRSAGDHLLALVNDVLDLSGLESGELRLALQPVDIGALVGQSVALVAPLAARHGVTIDAEPAIACAMGDATRLRQVLINLLSNAIKYNRRGGSVAVKVERQAGDAVKLSVRDTGCGLTRAELAVLFEPFTRFGADRVGVEGTGIGLTIVRALVRGMGGTIAVASTPGQGTVFEVVLSASAGNTVAASPELSGESSGRGPASDAGERSGQILYIEDNPVNVLLVEELIRSVGGLTLVSEATGGAGVAKARAMRPDLVLVDLQLPDFDGYEVLRRLRDDPATEAIRCVALSANALPEDIERGLAAGFTDYWTKPIDFGAFVPALKRLFPAPA